MDGGATDTLEGPSVFASYYASEQPPFPADTMVVAAGEFDGWFGNEDHRGGE